MKSLLGMVVGCALCAGVLSGCATGGAAGEDKVAKWQSERTPVEVLKSKITVKAAAAAVEALDVAPFGIYKAVADKVDKKAVLERYRRIYLGYIGDVQGILNDETKNPKPSHKEACKMVLDQIRAQADGEQTIAKMKEYLKAAKESDFEAIEKWIQTVTRALDLAGQKFAAESPNVLQVVVDLAKKEGGMAAMKIPMQAKDDIAVVGNQLKDAGLGLALYVEMINADRQAAKMQADYPVEM